MFSQRGFSPDGALIVSASLDNTSKIWEVATGNLVHTLRGHKGPVEYAEFSSNGKLISTSSSAKLFYGTPNYVNALRECREVYNNAYGTHSLIYGYLLYEIADYIMAYEQFQLDSASLTRAKSLLFNLEETRASMRAETN